MFSIAKIIFFIIRSAKKNNNNKKFRPNYSNQRHNGRCLCTLVLRHGRFDITCRSA